MRKSRQYLEKQKSKKEKYTIYGQEQNQNTQAVFKWRGSFEPLDPN